MKARSAIANRIDRQQNTTSQAMSTAAAGGMIPNVQYSHYCMYFVSDVVINMSASKGKEKSLPSPSQRQSSPVPLSPYSLSFTNEEKWAAALSNSSDRLHIDRLSLYDDDMAPSMLF